MKKKGFTLVELLAVIAILAILVIIALPNIMDLFNQAKLNSFKNEVKEVFKAAQNQWMIDSLNINGEKIYGKGDFDDEDCGMHVEELKLSGRELTYGIRFDKSGNVHEYMISDGTYCFDAYDLKSVEDIKDEHFHPVPDDVTVGVWCDAPDFILGNR